MPTVNDNLGFIEAAKRNEEWAWEKLINTFKKTIWSIIEKYHFRYDEKEDLFQDIALKLVKNIKYYDSDKASFSTFLSTVSNRTCIDKLRRESVKIFMITEEVLRTMESVGLPTEILDKLVAVEDQKYISSAGFLNVLEGLLGKEKIEEYFPIILKYSKRYLGRRPQTSIHDEEFKLAGPENDAVHQIQTHDVLKKLPADIRELLIYRYKGYSYEEIAKIMDKKYHWVKNSLNRNPVLVKLRKSLDTNNNRIKNN